MGIEDFIKARAKSVSKDEKALFDEADQYLDPAQQEKLLHGNFEGHKGGISDFAIGLYHTTAKELDALHDANKEQKPEKQLSKDQIRLTALESLILKNVKKLGKNKRAQEWVNHYETLAKSGGFPDQKEREQTLYQMLEVLGLGEEEQKLVAQYADQASKGNSAGYRGTLRKLSQAVEENTYGRRQQSLVQKIAEDKLLSSKAQGYFAQRILSDHKHHVGKTEDFFKKSFLQHAQEYHRIRELKSLDTKEEIKKLGYMAQKEKK